MVGYALRMLDRGYAVKPINDRFESLNSDEIN